MSVDRDPQVGDRFRWRGWSDASRKIVRTVVTVHDQWVYWRSDETSGSVLLSRWSERATLVPPRLKDDWGVISDGTYWNWFTEKQARSRADSEPDITLARIVNGRVCDEHGVPFEVAAQ